VKTALALTFALAGMLFSGLVAARGLLSRRRRRRRPRARVPPHPQRTVTEADAGSGIVRHSARSRRQARRGRARPLSIVECARPRARRHHQDGCGGPLPRGAQDGGARVRACHGEGPRGPQLRKGPARIAARGGARPRAGHPGLRARFRGRASRAGRRRRFAVSRRGHVRWDTGTQSIETKTDARGAFRIEGVGPGLYSLRAYGPRLRVRLQERRPPGRHRQR
jgi:hypothetical protein